LGESVYGEQLNGAENQRPGSSVNIGALSAPRDHSGSPGAPPTGVSVAALRSPARTGKAMLSRRRSSSAPPPPGLQVNRGTCHFGRHKNPRRPHPPPRASQVSHHPPQVSGLTLAHPGSPGLTHLHLPSPTAVRSINRIMPCGPILRSWPARPKWAPTTVPFLGCTAHDGESTLNTTLSLISLSHLLVSFSPFCNLSPCPLYVDRRSVVLPSASTPILRFVTTLHFSSYCTRSLITLTFTDRLTVFRWVENAAPRITSEQQRRMAG
jgi:hypothetical protein